MKCFFAFVLVLFSATGLGHAVIQDNDHPNENNVFIITLDGFRWQELFAGADRDLINNTRYTADTAFNKAMYWHEDQKRRREKLMPFFWNVIAKQGQLFGNRELGSKVNTKNMYMVSYPGYNEIFTGATDPLVSSNKRKKNKNVNLLEYLNRMPEFQGKVAVFTSWDAFPYILNKERSHLYINSGNQMLEDENMSYAQAAINKLQTHPEYKSTPTRNDMLTFLSAKEYIMKHLPRVLVLGLGGTDEAGHDRKYDQYLKEANQSDRIIADLWNLVQSIPQYKNNTTFIITTDHGRGSKKSTWHKHGFFVNGSSETWMAFLGKGVRALGEYAGEQQLYQKYIAGTAGYLLGVTSFNKKMLPVTFFEAPDARIIVRKQH